MSAVVLAGATPSSADTACPIEFAVYHESHGGTVLEFRPSEGVASNSFRLILVDSSLLEGFVMWADKPARPYGLLTYNCPEGDVTGEEIAACSVWEGAIYAVDPNGGVTPLPLEGVDAPQTLILSDFAGKFHVSVANDLIATTAVPGDVFQLAGCRQ